MSNTVISYLQKMKDGFIFHETFENDDFVVGSNWLQIQGTASNTGLVTAKEGIKSLLLAGTTDSNGYPIILKKEITDFDIESEQVLVWFYDTGDTSLPGPFLKIETTDSAYIQVGVRNAVSTTKYSCNGATNVSQDNFSASSISRTVGWHSLLIEKSSLTGPYAIYIDDTLARSITGTNAPVKYVSLQADVASHAADSFGYFDSLQINRANSVQIYGTVGRTINVKDSTETLQTVGQTSYYSTIELGVLGEPENYSIEIARSTSNVLMATRLGPFEMKSGDKWKYVELDMGYKTSTPRDVPTTLGSVSHSTNGTVQRITTGLQDRISFSFPYLFDDLWTSNVQNFFQYARTGGPFSVSVDFDEVAFSVITVAASAGASSVTVGDTLGQHYLGITSGDYYMLQDTTNNNRQILKVLSASYSSTSTVTFTDVLAFDVAVGCYLRPLRYFPMLELDGDSAPLDYANIKNKRQTWTLNCREYIA